MKIKEMIQARDRGFESSENFKGVKSLIRDWVLSEYPYTNARIGKNELVDIITDRAIEGTISRNESGAVNVPSARAWKFDGKQKRVNAMQDWINDNLLDILREKRVEYLITSTKLTHHNVLNNDAGDYDYSQRRKLRSGAVKPALKREREEDNVQEQEPATKIRKAELVEGNESLIIKIPTYIAKENGVFPVVVQTVNDLEKDELDLSGPVKGGKIVSEGNSTEDQPAENKTKSATTSDSIDWSEMDLDIPAARHYESTPFMDLDFENVLGFSSDISFVEKVELSRSNSSLSQNKPVERLFLEEEPDLGDEMNWSQGVLSNVDKQEINDFAEDWKSYVENYVRQSDRGFFASFGL
jgi:hypothetical protein